MTKRVTIFFASDVHGSERCFIKFVNAAKFYKADVLVLGGDITGKALVPLIQEGSAYRASFLGQNVRLEANSEVADFEKQVRHAGAYPFRTNPEEMAAMEADRALVDQLFTRLMCESVERWCEIAAERLAGSGVRCFISAGNDDEPEIVDVLTRAPYVEMPEGQVITLEDGHEMISSGFANTTPWHAPRDIADDDLRAFIDQMASQLTSPDRAVFNLHVPPYATGLDTAPLLTDDLKPIVVAGDVQTGPVGSKAVRQEIETYQPIVSLHGHVHESRGVTKLGRTTAINPGSEYGDGRLRGALVTLKGDKLAGYQLVTG
jgi:uncharacterized protein